MKPINSIAHKAVTAFLFLLYILAPMGMGIPMVQAQAPVENDARAVKTAAPEPIVIALDAGHGGADPGALGAELREADMTEQAVLLLEEKLAADPHFLPVLTRAPHEGKSIDQRVAAADAAGAQLLISLHGNSDGRGVQSGFEVYAAPPGRTHHAKSLAFAQSVAQKAQEGGAQLRGETGVRYLYYFENSHVLPAGQDRMSVEASDTTLRDLVSFGILEKPDCPSVLIEQCFVTNAQDAAQWGAGQGLADLVQTYYEAVCDLFGTTPVYYA